ncbi:SET domain-containing protein [Whalleya microplaca]|nr:SET domain-containing protein [Whalleya microplaca]
MKRGQFSLKDLPAWSVLNNVTFVDVKASDVHGRGYGLSAGKDLINEEDTSEDPVLLIVPRDLVLSAEGVQEYARENKDFRQLLDAAGHQSTRCDILLFLLFQRVLSSPDYTGDQGAATPWAQYFNLLPEKVPVPTMWTESELFHLKGTSLGPAVSAKLSVLTKEFDEVKSKTAALPYWDELFSIDEAITIHDWVWLDALYRSRSLGLPRSGESMVPCLDLVNHSSPATAYFEENDEDEVVLLLREGCRVSSGDEITINYGKDKSPAEMLFSYGFIDKDSVSKSITVILEPMEDDPLGRIKLHAFGAPPTLKIQEDDDGFPQWDAPFAYLMCLNEEDGLLFQVLQETDGSRHLRIFWEGVDITDRSKTIKDLIKGHSLQQIFELRVVTVIFEVLQRQLEVLNDHEETDEVPGLVRAEILQASEQLRVLEKDILEKSLKALDEQRNQLLADESVVAYLESMEVDQNEAGDNDVSNDEDFS